MPLYEVPVGNHSPTMLGDPGSNGLLVPVRSLDECVHEWGIDRIDLMKIDVEGYEPEVFAGAVRTIAGGRYGRSCASLTPTGRLARERARENSSGSLEFGFVDRSGISRVSRETPHLRTDC